MATYTGTRKLSGVVPIQNAIANITVPSFFSLTVALALNDVINMMDVPAGAIITGMDLVTDALDTNGSSTISYDVGDAGSPQRFIAAQVQPNNAILIARMNVASGFGFQYTSQTTIQVKVHAGPATGATSGLVRLLVSYNMQGITATS